MDEFEFDKRAMTEEEDKYTFLGSPQICNRTGLIGYLRADMGTDGDEFFSSWNDWASNLKTGAFQAEFDVVINSLREEGDILHDLKALADYCHGNPQSKMNSDRDYYGVRVDTDEYTYLLRLNPNRGDYHLYCYCYVKSKLNRYIRDAREGIQFRKWDGEKLFWLPDGGKIRIRYPDGSTRDVICRYINEFEAEIDGKIYHVVDYHATMVDAGLTYEPVRDALPLYCYSTLSASAEVIIIRRNESGYYKTDIPVEDIAEAVEIAEDYNRKLGITKAQEAAMKFGSMFGWATPGADPVNYDLDGQPKIRSKE